MTDLNRNVDAAVRDLVQELVSDYLHGNKADARSIWYTIPQTRIALATLYTIREFSQHGCYDDAVTFIRSVSS